MCEEERKMEYEKQSTKLNKRNNDQKWKRRTNTEVGREETMFQKKRLFQNERGEPKTRKEIRAQLFEME